jgi:RNA polymerase sigma-70 factor (ECF subfamily)
MADTLETDCKDAGGRGQNMTDRLQDLHAWFLREVLPLEAVLTQYLRNNWRNRADVADLLQDVYVQVYDAAAKQLPKSTKSFVFITARNLLIDRVRRDKVIPLEAVEDLDALGAAADAPGPEAHSIAREELRRVQAALDQIPARSREAFVLYHVENLSQREVAARMNISENTVGWYLKTGLEEIADLLFSEQPSKRAKP